MSSPCGERTVVRVGLLLDSYTIEAWQAAVIDTIIEQEYSQVVVVVVNGARDKRPPFWQRLWRARGRILYSLYERADRFVFRFLERRAGREDAMARTDVRGRLAGIPAVEVSSIRRGKVNRMREDDLRCISEFDVDVLIRFGFGILKGDALKLPRFGVWSYHHGDNEHYRGTPPLFWEIHEGQAACGVILQRLTEALDAGDILYKSFTSVDRLSLYRSRNRHYWKSVSIVERCLNELRREGVIAPKSGGNHSNRLYKMPSNLVMLAYLARLAMQAVQRVYRRIFLVEKWFVAFNETLRDIESIKAESQDNWNIVEAPQGRFFADPFGVRFQGRSFVFFEDYSFRARKGVISAFEISAGVAGPVVQVLLRNEHLSYPFMFVANGSLFMLPECSESGSVVLYRCTTLPDRWEHAATLLEGVAGIDSTIFHWDGVFWLFTCIPNRRSGTADELHLFCAESLFGPWRPHACNPVKSDVRSTRPAGALFAREGRIFRPAQNCAGRYGREIVLCEVEALSTTTYRERVCEVIIPIVFPGNHGSHTLNFSGGVCVTDGRVFSYKWLA